MHLHVAIRVLSLNFMALILVQVLKEGLFLNIINYLFVRLVTPACRSPFSLLCSRVCLSPLSPFWLSFHLLVGPHVE